LVNIKIIFSCLLKEALVFNWPKEKRLLFSCSKKYTSVVFQITNYFNCLKHLLMNKINKPTLNKKNIAFMLLQLLDWTYKNSR